MKKELSLILTADGYLALEEELNELKTVKRPEIIKALQEARAQGDLSENADYDAARSEQAQIEAKIKELEYRLEHSEIACGSKKGTIMVGSIVTVIDEYGDEDTYRIVGSVEADSFNNKISNESPLGKALIGHKENDDVTVEAPNGQYTLKIAKVA
ncbi:MAG: transcription elongation factor GreA [Mollicutes bacterium]|nr:transcription elongation factor GreA [Mollicutes bacterium]